MEYYLIAIITLLLSTLIWNINQIILRYFIRCLPYKKLTYLVVLFTGTVVFTSGCSVQPHDQEQAKNDTEEIKPSAENYRSLDDTVNELKEEGPTETDKADIADSTLQPATVTRVVDGDTIKVNIDDRTETVRLLLIDTPETVAPNNPVEPYGPEASEFVKETILGETVGIIVGSEERDHYDRLLAYVFIDGETIQEKLLRKGLGRTAYLYNDLSMLDEFHEAQEEAIKQGTGIWSIPGYAHKDHNHGYHYEEDATSASESSDSNNSDRPSYKNCAAAREANVAPIQKGDPGYAAHLDGDGDGVACE